MPRFVATVESTWTAERALAYMADFGNAHLWDPSVAAAESLDPAPPHLGSAFDLSVDGGGGRLLQLHYVITDLTREAVELRARTRWLRSHDRITVTPRPGGCRVTYDARLLLSGIAWPASPVMAILFRRTAGRALTSLRRILSTP